MTLALCNWIVYTDIHVHVAGGYQRENMYFKTGYKLVQSEREEGFSFVGWIGLNC